MISICPEKLFDIRGAKRLSELSFPLRFTKLNNVTGVRQELSLVRLSDTDLPAYKAAVSRWEAYIDGFSRNIQALYLDEIHNKDAQPDIHPIGNFPNIAFRNDRQTYYISSGKEIEGTLCLFVHGPNPCTSVSFIGLAPWNVSRTVNGPVYHGLAPLLAKLSLLCALNEASDAADNSYIYHSRFQTDLSISFAQKYFKLKDKFPGDISLNINKKGVAAFLLRDFDIFTANRTADLL